MLLEVALVDLNPCQQLRRRELARGHLPVRVLQRAAGTRAMITKHGKVPSELPLWSADKLKGARLEKCEHFAHHSPTLQRITLIVAPARHQNLKTCSRPYPLIERCVGGRDHASRAVCVENWELVLEEPGGPLTSTIPQREYVTVA